MKQFGRNGTQAIHLKTVHETVKDFQWEKFMKQFGHKASLTEHLIAAKVG